MNRPKLSHPAALALLAGLALLPGIAPAGNGTVLRASDVTVKIEGESTLHAWQATASSVSVSAGIHAGESLSAAVKDHGLDGLALVLDVDSLKSTEGGGMDKNMWNAFEADKFPKIQFNMKSYRLEGQTVTAQGDLSMHGQTKAVTLSGFADIKGNKLAIKGVYLMKMSDFGIKPPVMMFGTIRTSDPVKIYFGFKLND
jgi:hypothetical protein